MIGEIEAIEGGDTIEGIAEGDPNAAAMFEGGLVMIDSDQGKSVRVREMTVPGQVMIDEDQLGKTGQGVVVNALQQWGQSFGCLVLIVIEKGAALTGLPLEARILIGPRRSNFPKIRGFLHR